MKWFGKTIARVTFLTLLGALLITTAAYANAPKSCRLVKVALRRINGSLTTNTSRLKSFTNQQNSINRTLQTQINSLSRRQSSLQNQIVKTTQQLSNMFQVEWNENFVGTILSLHSDNDITDFFSDYLDYLYGDPDDFDEEPYKSQYQYRRAKALIKLKAKIVAIQRTQNDANALQQKILAYRLGTDEAIQHVNPVLALKIRRLRSRLTQVTTNITTLSAQVDAYTAQLQTCQ